MRNQLVVVAILLAVAACSGDDPPGPGGNPDGGTSGDGDGDNPGDPDARPAEDPDDLPPCAVPGPAIVTDIDATLTTSDNEFLTQMLVAGHDPAEREGAHDLVSAYAERGYFILYLTSRPDGAPMASGATTREATEAWLGAHGFPIDPDRTRVELAAGLVYGDSAAGYKGGALVAMEEEGFRFDFAYGNAASDITAYEQAEIPKDVTFIIGPEAGTAGTVAVAGEGWTEHAAEHLPDVPSICQ